VSIRVTASADKDEVTGYDSWRRRICVSISQPPESGKANKQLITFFNSLFQESTRISISAGKKSRDKRITVEGINIETVQEVFHQLFE
jgi:uncharacterized protein (TIGR00251 family)